MKVEPETIENVIKSMEGMLVKHNEPLDLIHRLANAVDRELDALNQRLEEVERMLAL